MMTDEVPVNNCDRRWQLPWLSRYPELRASMVQPEVEKEQMKKVIQNFVNTFSVSISMTIWFFSFILLIWWITLINFKMLKTPHSFLEYTWFIIIFLYSWIQFAGICLTFLYLYSWERSICNFLAVILCGFNTNFLVYLKFLVKLQELLLANGKLQWKFRLLSFIIMAQGTLILMSFSYSAVSSFKFHDSLFLSTCFYYTSFRRFILSS